MSPPTFTGFDWGPRPRPWERWRPWRAQRRLERWYLDWAPVFTTRVDAGGHGA